MSEKTAVQEFLEALNSEIEKSTSEKVTKAMRLFIQIDNTMKGVVLHGSPFYGGRKPLTAPNLREWFDTLDLMDDLDNLIYDMEDDLRHNAQLHPAPAKRDARVEALVGPAMVETTNAD